jgi:hypothetical protein
MEAPSTDFAKDIKVIIDTMEKKPEIPPPEPVNPYPPHVPYAPAELLEKNEESCEKSEKSSEESEESEESLEETSKEIELHEAEEAYRIEAEREIKKEFALDNKILKKYEKVNKAIRNKAIEIADKEFELNILKKKHALLRKKRNLLDETKEYRKVKGKMSALQKLHDNCQLLREEEEEEEDEAYEEERIKREVFRFQKALEIRACEKKAEKKKGELVKKQKELAKEENDIALEQAKYFEFMETRKKEIAEEDAGKWPGEPRWAMLYN